MTQDVWLPKGYVLPDGARIRSLLHAGDAWQLFATDGPNTLLLARPQLAEQWSRHGLLDAAVFGRISFGSETLYSLSSGTRYRLEPVASAKSPENTVDALAFALALKESRTLAAEGSFHDALYTEQYARLLPTWTLTPAVADELVLGMWLTGGVSVSTASFRRLNQLTGWMPAGELAKIVRAAGFTLPADADVLSRSGSAAQAQNSKAAAETTAEATPDAAPETAPEAASEVASGAAGTGQKRPAKEPTQAKVFKLPGRPQLERFFNEHVLDIIYNSEKYRALGIDFPSAVVLHGPPGCGKTFAVDRLVECIDWPVYAINSNTIGSPYIHATSKKISEIFDQAIDNAPAVVVIDEMESFLTDRTQEHASSTHHVEEVAEFLRRIPEAIAKRVLIIAMTNMIDTIDPAVLRRGRFDHVIQVDMPSREDVASLVHALLSTLPTEDALDLEDLIDELTGKALSDAAFVVRESARLTARSGKTRIDQESIDAALAGLPREQATQQRAIGFARKP